jgi:hypothetical protein
MGIRTYSELRRLETFEDRFNYLSLRGEVGARTFGWERYVNQQFYRSRQWRLARRDVIARDLGCDLGISGYEIFDKIIIHHMNPMTVDDISHGEESILDPEFLVSTAHKTHNAIHYGDATSLPRQLVERSSGDTTPWRRE